MTGEPNVFKSFFFRSGLERIQLGTTPKGTEKIEHKGNRKFDSLEKSLFTLSRTL